MRNFRGGVEKFSGRGGVKKFSRGRGVEKFSVGVVEKFSGVGSSWGGEKFSWGLRNLCVVEKF